MDSSTYRHLLGQIKKSCSIPHYNFPSHNLLSSDTLQKVTKDLNVSEDVIESWEFMSTFPCYTPFEYQVETCVPFYCGSGSEDIVHDLIKKKRNWQRSLKNIRILDIETGIESITKLKKGKETKISRKLIKYIKHFCKDPDPDFNGNHYRLYTGGTLASTNLNNDVVLISADYLNNKAGINIFKLDKSLDKYEKKYVYHLQKNYPVLQVNVQTKNNDLIILSRQKNCINLLLGDTVDSLGFCIEWLKAKNKFRLFMCCDINQDSTEIAVGDNNCDVNLYNIETKKTVFEFKNQNVYSDPGDQWIQVLYGASNMVYIADTKKFHVLDARDFFGRTALSYDPSALINNCEGICSISRSSVNSNYFYIGTTHNLIQIDIRNSKSVQRWTHLMKRSPQFISCVKNGSSEFLVLQSHVIDEAIGIANDYLGDELDANFISRSLPQILTSVKESLKIARHNGVCLNPLISKRFDFTVCGICSLEGMTPNIPLFVTNSSGDIFLSKITKDRRSCFNKNYSARTEEVIQSMRLYESSLEEALPVQSYNHQPNIKDFNYILNDIKTSNFKAEKNPKGVSWKYDGIFDVKNLQVYKDVLAQKILKVWGIDSELCEDADLTMTSEDKVRKWMESNP